MAFVQNGLKYKNTLQLLLKRGRAKKNALKSFICRQDGKTT